MRLRGRLALLFLFAAFVPFTALFVVVQTSLIEELHEEHARQLQTRVASAQRRLSELLERDQRAVRALCDHDLVVDRLALQLGGGHFGPEDEQGLVTLLPPMMRGRRFDTLHLIDAQGGTDRGRVLGAGHYPDSAGGRAAELVDALARNDGQAFVHDVRVLEEDGTRRDRPTLLGGCMVQRDGAAVAVLGGHFLSDQFAEDLMGDVSPVEFALVEAGAEPELSGEPVEVGAFHDARGETVLRLVAAIDAAPLEHEVAALKQRTLYVALIALIVALLAAILMTWSLTRPLSELEEAAKRVASGDLESQLTVRGGGGEMGRTMRAFNDMTRELASTRKKLLRAERIAAWREVARRIAHEIKNPLQPIQMEIETMRKLHERKHPSFDEEFPASTQVILDEVKRLDNMVTEFSRFARLPRPKPEALDLLDVVEHVRSLHHGGVELVIDAERAIVRADRSQLTQVLVNLVQNATDAAEARHGELGGRVELTLRGDDEGATLEIADNGPGIPEADRLRVFEPYFTTKAKGTGLGLAIVHRIVGDHGGTIDVEDGIDGGAAFIIQLPVSGAAAEIEASLGETDLPLGRPDDTV